MTLFNGEDFHIMLPSLGSEVTFRNRSAVRAPDVILMRGGIVVNSRAKINRYLSHLIIDAVAEGDEGVYTIKNPDKPEDIRHIVLVVRGKKKSWNLNLNLSFEMNWKIQIHISYRKKSKYFPPLDDVRHHYNRG